MSASRLSRRAFLQLAVAAPVLADLDVVSGFSRTQARPITNADPWQEPTRILARIKEPTFPRRDVDATKHKTINDAIDACRAAGGGRVVVPAGSFTTGPIRLKSRVNLHLAAGAVLKFSANPQDYLPAVYTRFE